MKSLMTLWNVEFLYPKGTPSFFISPVQNCRKFSAVRGTMSAYNSIRMRPKNVMVKYKTHFAREKFEGPHGHLPISTPPTLTSKKTTGLWGCRSWPGKINVTFKIIGKQKIIVCNSNIWGPVYTSRNSEPWQARQSIGGVARVVVKC